MHQWLDTQISSKRVGGSRRDSLRKDLKMKSLSMFGNVPHANRIRMNILTQLVCCNPFLSPIKNGSVSLWTPS